MHLWWIECWAIKACGSNLWHEVLHQLGQGPDGDRKLARLLGEHLHHHPMLEQAVFQELAAHRGFQNWILERLRGPQDPRNFSWRRGGERVIV